MDEDVYIQIEAYLGGSMNPEEVMAFEAKMASDIELAKEVNLYDAINHHIRTENWKAIGASEGSAVQKELADYFESPEATAVEQTLKKVQKTYSAANTAPKKKYPFLNYAAAIAVILIGAISFFLLQPASYDDLYVSYYSPKDLPSLVSRGATVSQEVRTGVIAFEQNEHQKAISAFTEYIKETTTPNPQVYGYLGMSYVASGMEDKAVAAFDQLLQSDSIDRSKALWYKCLLYLKTEQPEKLKTTLSLILQDPTNYNHAKAKALLDEL